MKFGNVQNYVQGGRKGLGGGVMAIEHTRHWGDGNGYLNKVLLAECIHILETHT